MALMSAAARARALADLSRELSDERVEMPLTKPELTAALAAADVWLDGQAAAFNTALPPAAQALSQPHKRRLLAIVALRRHRG